MKGPKVINFRRSSQSTETHISWEREYCYLSLGASEPSNQTLSVSTISLKNINGGEIPISVFMIPRISQLLCNLPFYYVKELPCLKDIGLAHAVSDGQEFDISVLIRVDFTGPLYKRHDIN